jgi:hypothetical protein
MARTKQRTRTSTARRSAGRQAAAGRGRRFPRRKEAQPTGWLQTITSRLPGSTGTRGKSSGSTRLVQQLLSRVQRKR